MTRGHFWAPGKTAAMEEAVRVIYKCRVVFASKGSWVLANELNILREINEDALMVTTIQC